MKSDIETLIECYGVLEQQVRQQMERLCGRFCSICQKVCCRSHFCEETLESVFLKHVAERFSPKSVFHPTDGWLSSNGCTLVAGRPPVCYEFSCKEISSSMCDDPDCRYALLVLSGVMTYVGKKAVGGRHLVELTRLSDLNRIRSNRFIKRLDEAQSAYFSVIDVLDGRLSSSSAYVLQKIL